ncbi:LysR family transcriptional regulator [Acuticoccus sp. M5D2P5]|uniref:LysR family transcriptional regulator n=1 Tax=Acuticoccus kalidii TaxID=2910977 RepID=UPI001F32AB79|nr:LysR family transcriptional regulator [Acuticoccus kalidii]MCF3936712.1 LysR family transcriptional regulator [Acuticoccus kalidii]
MALRNLTIRQLQAFMAVIETGNFTRAAARCGVSQPSLSQAIKDLEAELGVPLFSRTTRRVEPTAAGHEFSADAARILADLERSMESVRDLALLRRGRVRVALPPLLAASVLPAVIERFQRERPGLTVDVADIGSDQIVAHVRSGEADLGIGTFPQTDGIQTAHIMRDHLVALHPAGVPLAAEQPTDWTALAAYPLITLRKESGIRRLVERGFEEAGLPFRPAFEVHQILTAIAMVEAGLGLAVLPRYALLSANARTVGHCALIRPEISRDVVQITAEGRILSPAAQAFGELVREVLRRTASPGARAAPG